MLFSHKGERLNYKLVGVVFKTFIIIELEDDGKEEEKEEEKEEVRGKEKEKELYLIDQHASHERILFEQVKESYNQNKTPDVQMLLVPIILDLTQSEFETVMDNEEVFKKVGLTNTSQG